MFVIASKAGAHTHPAWYHNLVATSEFTQVLAGHDWLTCPLIGGITCVSPTGQTYTTRPGSRLLFPSLCLHTGELPIAPTTQLPPGQLGIMMPKRRRTRQQDRAHRIDTERALNAGRVAERNQPPPF